MKIYIVFLLSLGLMNCIGQSTYKNEAKNEKKEYQFKVSKTEKEWRNQLSDMQYYILREAGTERPFTGTYNSFKRKGVFLCIACATPLYESKYKFDSGTGWPSFWKGKDQNIIYDVDYKAGYARTELLCATCGGHLGHVFDDGPKPTGKRHCINSAALQFERLNE